MTFSLCHFFLIGPKNAPLLTNKLLNHPAKGIIPSIMMCVLMNINAWKKKKHSNIWELNSTCFDPLSLLNDSILLHPELSSPVFFSLSKAPHFQTVTLGNRLRNEIVCSKTSALQVMLKLERSTLGAMWCLHLLRAHLCIYISWPDDRFGINSLSFLQHYL